MVMLATGKIVCEFSLDVHGAKVPHPRSLSKNGEGGRGDSLGDRLEYGSEETSPSLTAPSFPFQKEWEDVKIGREI